MHSHKFVTVAHCGFRRKKHGVTRLSHTRCLITQVSELKSRFRLRFKAISESILENVVFFDPNLDMERLIECLNQSALYEEVQAMGMQTLVGDMGTTLSGGQKQRLLVARALYKQPEILILHEATSHLNMTNQAVVHQAPRAMGRTHISITHREELLEAADRVFVLHEVKLTPRASTKPPLSLGIDNAPNPEE
jgi:ATP-binding cassette, subfamily B, bacterial CvaB/MchF/RaxB